jgi:predicted permease
MIQDLTPELFHLQWFGVAQRFAADHPQVYNGDTTRFGATVVGLNDEMIAEATPILLGLLATAALVLLIACANVANLSLSRMSRREREMAVRVALRAGRGRLLRQLLTESSILALAGGAIGLGLAWASLDMLATFASRFTPRVIDPSIDPTVLLFTLGVSLTTGLVFGIIPALAARPSLTVSLKEGGAQAGDGMRARRMRSALVVAQVAVCFALLVGAALFLDSLRRLSSVDLGYRADRVLTAEVYANWSRQTSQAEVLTFYTTLLDRPRSTPGVTHAAITNAVPLSNNPARGAACRDRGAYARRRHGAAARGPDCGQRRLLEALMIPVIRGRVFTPADHLEAPLVAVINQTMAELWEGREPVGRSVPDAQYRAVDHGALRAE